MAVHRGKTQVELTAAGFDPLRCDGVGEGLFGEDSIDPDEKRGFGGGGGLVRGGVPLDALVEPPPSLDGFRGGTGGRPFFWVTSTSDEMEGVVRTGSL